MSTDLMNISAFKGQAPAQAFQVLDNNAESLADGIGSSYGIVTYKGKVWGLRLRGDHHMFVRPDDGSPAAYLDVIILRSPGYKSKSYYPPGTFQDGQIGVRPLCAALDGVSPDDDITDPQSNACAVCPKNVFKLNAEGRKSRECSDYKRLAVLIMPSQSKALLGAPLMEPVFLRVPAASLNDLAILGDAMQAQGFHYSSYVTRIGFNPEKPHPQMTFRALTKLGDKEAPIVLPLRVDPTALRITGENETGGGKVTRLQPTAPATATATFTDQAAQAAAQVAALAEAKRLADIEAAQAAAEAKKAAEAEAARVAQAAAAAAKVDENIDTGFGDLTGTAATVTAAVKHVAAQNTVADTGSPEQADDDLDARITSLLPKLGA